MRGGDADRGYLSVILVRGRNGVALMKVYFVRQPVLGIPELAYCIKADRLLRNSHIIIYAGSLVNTEILSLLPEGAEKHDSANLDLQEIKALFLNAKERDIDVIRLHSGDPSILTVQLESK